MASSEIERLKKAAENAKARYETAQTLLKAKLDKIDERATMIYGRAARQALSGVPDNERYALFSALRDNMTAAEIEWLKKHDR